MQNKKTQHEKTQKQEITVAQTPETVERIRNRRVFVPRTDIYETADNIVLTADMPGVDQKGVEITLEKNVLTIQGNVEPLQSVKEMRQVHTEFEEGDYQRAFTLSDEIDRENISASVKNGQLKLILPKAGPAKVRKIEVVAG
jgi:HSP20 family molecular chaperone IbpA